MASCHCAGGKHAKYRCTTGSSGQNISKSQRLCNHGWPTLPLRCSTINRAFCWPCTLIIFPPPTGMLFNQAVLPAGDAPPSSSTPPSIDYPHTLLPASLLIGATEGAIVPKSHIASQAVLSAQLKTLRRPPSWSRSTTSPPWLRRVSIPRGGGCVKLRNICTSPPSGD